MFLSLRISNINSSKKKINYDYFDILINFISDYNFIFILIKYNNIK